MKLHKLITVLIFASACLVSKAQTIEVLSSGNGVSVRGLSVVSDKVFWLSGTKGSVGRSIDGGKTVQWQSIPGHEKKDFRDIEAFDAYTAVIVSIASPLVILRTTDAGKNWKQVFENSDSSVFVDAFAFNRKGKAVAFGDPMNGKAYMLTSEDFGKSWKELQNPPALHPGEACFASSGTNLVTLENGKYIMATGGKSSRLFVDDKVYPLPLMQGGETTGANSIDILGDKAIIVGGDFTRNMVDSSNCALVDLKNPAAPVITVPEKNPNGYRSCVVYLDPKTAVAAGTSGVDISTDGGKTWKLITRDGFHVVQKAKKGKAVFLAGGNGKVAVMKF